MNGSNNSVQKSFRLNLNNPDHAKIYQKLQNYNRNIYKSESMLIIEALKYFVTHIPPEFVTEENAIEDRLIHESELNAAVDDLKKYMDDMIHRELIGMMKKDLLSAGSEYMFYFYIQEVPESLQGKLACYALGFSNNRLYFEL